MKNSKKMSLLPWQQSAIHSFERKRNPRCVDKFRRECQGVKPKGESNSSFSVLHPSSGEDIVITVGSHLKVAYILHLYFEGSL